MTALRPKNIAIFLENCCHFPFSFLLKEVFTMSVQYRKNFETLCRAIRGSDAALMECRNHETGAVMWAICATNRLPDGKLECIPLARMLDDNLGSVVLPARANPGSAELN
jgi:hypothetical protein